MDCESTDEHLRLCFGGIGTMFYTQEYYFPDRLCEVELSGNEGVILDGRSSGGNMLHVT